MTHTKKPDTPTVWDLVTLWNGRYRYHKKGLPYGKPFFCISIDGCFSLDSYNERRNKNKYGSLLLLLGRSYYFDGLFQCPISSFWEVK
jgi:hypothetical protein